MSTTTFIFVTPWNGAAFSKSKFSVAGLPCSHTLCDLHQHKTIYDTTSNTESNNIPVLLLIIDVEKKIQCLTPEVQPTIV
jgi:hypothetical protein